MKTSFVYASRGDESEVSSRRFDSRGGGDGAVGEIRTSMLDLDSNFKGDSRKGCRALKAALKSSWTRRRTRCAWRK